MAKITYKRITLFLLLVGLFIVVAISYPYTILNALGPNQTVTKEELDYICRGRLFASATITQVEANDNEDIDNYLIQYKLFNLFNITNLKVKVLKNDNIYAGGNCLGFNITSKGVVVVGSNYILTANGAINPFADSGLEVGDIITHIDDELVVSADSITNYLQNYMGGLVTLKVLRGGQQHIISIQPALDNQTNTYKLGLWLKSDASGVGTLTFVNDDTGRFGSLGHAITNNSNQILEVSGGEIYEANVIGVNKGRVGSPGELLGIFNTTNPQGKIQTNTNFGVFGNVESTNSLTSDKSTIAVGGRLNVRPGKAQILCTIDGYNIETFDIEIIKTNFQSSAQEKSMVVRVIDKRLLNATGGIVQGMSGSPIIQDGKLIGAITHVFVNDPTKGFGLYIDWMLDQ